MNKETFANYGWIIVAVVVLAVMVAFATPFADYVANSTAKLISTFNTKSNDSLEDANSQEYNFAPLKGLGQTLIVGGKNQANEDLEYDATQVNDTDLYDSLVAFTSGSVDEVNVNNAMIYDVTVNGEYTTATLTFDMSGFAAPGDSVGVYHYNESTSTWEHIGNYTVDSQGQITASFTSLSPVAFVNLTNDYTAVVDPEPQEPIVDPDPEPDTPTNYVIHAGIYYGKATPGLPDAAIMDISGNFTINNTSYSLIGINSGGVLCEYSPDAIFCYTNGAWVSGYRTITVNEDIEVDEQQYNAFFACFGGNTVTLTASGEWRDEDVGTIEIRISRTPTVIWKQIPANKSAFPIVLNLPTNYYSFDIGPSWTGDIITDYTFDSSYWGFFVDKNGSFDLEIPGFDD